MALAQAAGYMADTGMLAGEYLDLLATRSAQILEKGQSLAQPQLLVAVTQLAYDLLRVDDPAAAEVASICAFLASEPVPADWFPRAASELLSPLADKAADPSAWRQVLARIEQHALARLGKAGLEMNQITQAILRGYLPPDQAAMTQNLAVALLTANHPGDEKLPWTWPGWARLLPHLVALDPEIGTAALRPLTYDATWYLIQRGDARSGYDLASRLYQQCLDQFGVYHLGTLAAASTLAVLFQALGQYDKARELDEDTLARRRRVLGEDHPDTLTSASNLATSLHALGEIHAARELDEDTLARRRRVLGEDHPDTLTSASNLANDLRALGEIHAARELDEDTLARKHRVLGEDHPDILATASNLANDLHALGEIHAARELDEDTLARRRRVLGEDHPDTLTSASNLADDLRALGEIHAARELDEDTLARRHRVLGEDHPDTLTSASNLADDLHAPGGGEDFSGRGKGLQVKRLCRTFGGVATLLALSLDRFPKALLQLDLSLGRMPRSTACPGGLRRAKHGVALDGYAIGLFDGAEAGGYACFAGGDGLAVAAAVGAFGQGLAEALDFAEVGFSFVGVRGDGEDGDAGGVGVEEEGDGLAVGVAACQGHDSGVVGLGPGLLGGVVAVSSSVVDAGEHEVGAVNLVAGGAEVLADRADVGAAGGAVAGEPGGLGVVGVVSRAGVDAQLGLQRRANRSGLDEADQVLGEVRCLRPGGQPDRQPPGGDMIDWPVPGVGCGGAVVDEPLVQRQLW